MNTITIKNRRLTIITLDFETFYEPKYRQSVMSTTDYVHDPRFKVHGVSVKIGDKPAQWHKTMPDFDWSRSALLCHNTLFDGYILHAHFNQHPAFYMDTLCMARAAVGHHQRLDLDTLGKTLGVGGKIEGTLAKTEGIRTLSAELFDTLGIYANNDSEKCHAIFEKLYGYVPDDELQLIDITLRMFCDPVLRVNRTRVKQELDTQIVKRGLKLMSTDCSKEQLASRNQFAALLQAAGARPPMKISKRTGKYTYAFAATDVGFKELLRYGKPQVRALCEARLAISSSIGETRAKRFLAISEKGRKLPVALNYSGAHTHRWSGSNKMNMQNLQRGGELRKSILAPPEHVLVVVDSSQIEARVVAWLAGQASLVQAFAESRDIYSEFASIIYGRTVLRKKYILDAEGNKIYPDFKEGFVGKTCILGLGYGMGPVRLKDTLMMGTNGPEVDLPLTKCAMIVDTYRNKYPWIKELWNTMQTIIHRMHNGKEGNYKCISYGPGFIRLPGGLFLKYPGLTSTVAGFVYQSRNGLTKLYGGLLTENVVQALARRIIAEQMLIISKKYRICLTTHDEILFTAPTKEGKTAYEWGLKIMSTAPEWAPGLPLAAEGGYAKEYSK